MIGILLGETLLIVKHGKQIITQPPPIYVAYVWLGCVLCVLLYCVYYFGIVGYWSRRRSITPIELDSDCDSVVRQRAFRFHAKHSNIYANVAAPRDATQHSAAQACAPSRV